VNEIACNSNNFEGILNIFAQTSSNLKISLFHWNNFNVDGDKKPRSRNF